MTAHITVNGIQIIESLKKSKRNSERLNEKFNKSLSVFPEEKDKINLTNVFNEYKLEKLYMKLEREMNYTIELLEN